MISTGPPSCTQPRHLPRRSRIAAALPRQGKGAVAPKGDGQRGWTKRRSRSSHQRQCCTLAPDWGADAGRRLPRGWNFKCFTAFVSQTGPTCAAAICDRRTLTGGTDKQGGPADLRDRPAVHRRSSARESRRPRPQTVWVAASHSSAARVRAGGQRDLSPAFAAAWARGLAQSQSRMRCARSGCDAGHGPTHRLDPAFGAGQHAGDQRVSGRFFQYLRGISDVIAAIFDPRRIEDVLKIDRP